MREEKEKKKKKKKEKEKKSVWNKLNITRVVTFVYPSPRRA